MEPGALEHDVAEVLPDVMHVAFDSAHHELADRLDARLGQQRAQPFESARHRLAGDEHLWDEEVAPLETCPNFLERRDERVEEKCLGRDAHLEAGVRQLQHLRRVADEREVVQLSEQLLGVHAAPSLRGR